MPSFMKVHWMNLMKHQIIQKFQSLEMLKEMATRQKNGFYHLIKINFNGLKMFSVRCRSYVQEFFLAKTCLVVH